jgi:hypothetical protein
MNILTLLIFTPVLFGFIILLLPSSMRASFKYITLFATLVQLGLSIWMYMNFKTGALRGHQSRRAIPVRAESAMDPPRFGLGRQNADRIFCGDRWHFHYPDGDDLPGNGGCRRGFLGDQEQP